MSFKKVAAIAAAAGALAAISVPAMAFENEIHGLYKMKYFIDNYETGGSGQILGANSAGVVPVPGGQNSTNLKTNNYFEQRARLFYTAKASDDLKLVTGFEIDSVWGDRAQGAIDPAAATYTGAFRNSGGAMESDAVNIETKWVYLDFAIPNTPTKAKVGIQAVKDSLKGIFLDADLAGIMTSSKVGSSTINVGYARAYDQSYFSTNKVRGQEDLHFGIIEGKFDVSKDLKLGAVYYLYADQRGIDTAAAITQASRSYSSMAVNTFGLTADAKLGPVDLSGFVAAQFGEFRDVSTLVVNAPTVPRNNFYQSAYAYNLAAKMAAGPGTLRTALLFTSGNGDMSRSNNNNRLDGWVTTQYSPNVNNSGYTPLAANSYNESNMMLLNRATNMGGSSTDNSLVYQANNGTSPLTGQGVYLLSLGYDAKITPKFYVNGNIGAAWAAKNNALRPKDQNVRAADGTRGVANGSSYMGSELNVETGYKMYDNLTASFQAAYVLLGGYYHNSQRDFNNPLTTIGNTPENPYTVRTVLTYAF